MTVYALEAARRLAPRFAARAAAHDRDGSFPVDDFRDLREAGLFGLMVPRALGGLGASFAEYAAVATELARGNGATALVFNMHASVTARWARSPRSWPRLWVCRTRRWPPATDCSPPPHRAPGMPSR